MDQDCTHETNQERSITGNLAARKKKKERKWRRKKKTPNKEEEGRGGEDRKGEETLVLWKLLVVKEMGLFLSFPLIIVLASFLPREV